jgi:small subunit ribosomal protein S20
VKIVEMAVAAGDKVKATELFAKAQSIVDKVADKEIFHKNKAARDKSRLSAKVKALSLAQAAA